MRYRVLGPIEISSEGQRLTPGGLKQRTVLAVLVAHADEIVSTERLVEATWGEDAPDGARRSLQTYISNLRGEIGDVISREGPGYRLTADRKEIDALRFEDEIVRAQSLEDEPDAAADCLRIALGEWRGRPYDDVDGGIELQPEITRLNELRMVALEARIDADLAVGRHREVIAELDGLTSEYPLRERFRAQQMVALFRSGRQAEALRAYQKTRTYLGDEVGIDPSPELRELEQRILDQDEDLMGAAKIAVVHRAVLVADIDGPDGLAALNQLERQEVVDEYGATFDAAVADVGGSVLARRGSAVYASFDSVGDAVAAAEVTQRSLTESGSSGPGLRMAIDVGDLESGGNGEVSGPPLSRSAGLAAAAWGGQVLMSAATQVELGEAREAGWQIKSLGEQPIQGLDQRTVVYQLIVPGALSDFGPLRAGGLPPGLPLGLRGLPGYELREVVGRGSFGSVHRGYQASVGREVAIKVIRPELANEAEFIRRFEVEAQLVARLEHPHIVPLYDYWRDPNGAYLVMRWLKGGTLEGRLRDGGQLSVAEAGELVAQLAPALDVAHRTGVIHRDIKPSNVLLDEEGNAYLSDFGIASETHSASAPTEPEVDERTDVAGLAFLLMEALGGAAPDSIATVLAKASSAEPRERYASMVDFVKAWEGASLTHGVPPETTQFTPSRNPYKGLAAFDEPDAEDLFGRTDVISALVAAVEQNRFVAVVGPSGIGKSSVVKAGLIPALRSGTIAGSESWLITDMTPGGYPFEELASAVLRISDSYPKGIDEDLRRDNRGLLRATKRLLPPASEAVLVIDQFEELFTLATDQGAAHDFLDALTALIKDPLANTRVVITLRADFFDHPLRHGDFGELLREATVPISAPTTNGLVAIVELPAANLGVHFDPGLVDQIVGDVKDKPAALPLLEYALAGLFEQRTSDTLTSQSYRLMGGVVGSLGQRAEDAYLSLGEPERDTARQVFLRLVTVTDTGEAVRRPTRRSELDRIEAPDAAVKEVLGLFGGARLLAFDRDQATRTPLVEVAHEAIFTQWPRLAGWIDEQREDLVLDRRLEAATKEWKGADRNSAFLLTAGRLDQFEAWTRSSKLPLSASETDYLEASRAAEDDRVARRRQRRRLVMGGFAAAAAVALVLALVALASRNDAQNKAALAEQLTEVANDQTARASEALTEAQAERESARQQAERADQAAVVALARQARALSATNPALAAAIAAEAQSHSTGPETAHETKLAVFEAKAALARSRLLLSFDGHSEAIRGLAVSPDGTRVVTAGREGVAKVWELETGNVILTISGHTDSLFAARFSPDGTRIVTSSQDGTARIWNAETGAEILRLAGSEDWVRWAEFNHDGTRVVTVARDGVAIIWDARSGEEIRRLAGHVDLETGELVQLRGVTYSPDGTRIATASHDGTAKIWNADTGEELLTVIGHNGRVFGLAFSPDGTKIATTSGDETVKIWDAATGLEIRPLEGHTNQVFVVAFSPDGTRIVTGSEDETAKVWDAETGDELFTLKGHSGHIRGIAFNHDGSRIVTSGEDGVGRVWNAATGQEVLSVNGASGALFGVAESPDGRLVVTGGEDGTALVFDATNGEERLRLSGHDAAIRSVAFSPDGTMIATASEDATSVVWEAATGTALVSFNGHTGPVRWVTFSPDGARVATASNDGSVIVWETQTGQKAFTLTGDEDTVEDENGENRLFRMQGVAFSPDGSLIATASEDGAARVFDAATGEKEFVISAGTDDLRSVAFSPDSSRIATAGFDRTVRIWEARRGVQVPIEFSSEAGILTVAFSSDGTEIVTAHDDRLGRLWDVTTRATLLTLLGHTDELTAATFGPDGTQILTSSEDGTVKVWDATTTGSCELVGFILASEDLKEAMAGVEPIACTALR